MKDIDVFKDFVIHGQAIFRGNVSVDCAIFGYHEGVLQLLLVKNKFFTRWCLPAAYVKKTESLDEAAARATAERAGLESLFLRQFKTLLNPGHNSTKSFDPEKLYELTGLKAEQFSWMSGETAAVGYYAITDIVKSTPTADFLSSECEWFPVNALPPLGFNHDELVQEAIATMRLHLYHFPVGKSLLPELFTLKEIKLFYETMSGKTLHISNFPNKLIAMGLIRKTDEKRKIGAHRSPTYYRFDDETYNKALEEGLVYV